METSTGVSGVKIAWVGVYPAHYMRALHAQVQREYGPRVRFIYVLPHNQDQALRSYERGDLPEGAVVLNERLPFSAMGAVWRAVSAFDPDVVLAFSQYPRSVVAGALWAWARGRHACYYTDTNLYDIMAKPWWWRTWKLLLTRPYLRRMWRICVLGEQNRAFLVWCTGRGSLPPTILMPYAHNPSIFAGRPRSKALLGVSDSTFVVLTVCRLIRQKAVEQVLEGMAALPPQAQENSLCVIVGDGPERPGLEALAASLGIAGRVRFLNAVPSDDVPEIFAAADVFLLTSTKEPWGLVVNEALSAGLPVVCPYWIGAASDLVHDGLTGIRLRDNSAGAIAKALLALQRDPEWRQGLGHTGREWVVRGGWTESGAMAGWRELFRQAEAERAAAPRAQNTSTAR